MKKLIILTLLAVGVCSCGPVHFTATPNDASIICTASKKYPVTVVVDNDQHRVNTVKEKVYVRGNQQKKQAKNYVIMPQGQHNIRVVADGKVVYSKDMNVKGGEKRAIKL